MGVISWVCVIKKQFCIEESHWVQRSCLLSGIEKRPFLGGWFYTKTVVISIRATDFVRCREVVLFSEGPLWEVRLYHQTLKVQVRAVRVERAGEAGASRGD